jgi:hypothetical protein
VLNKKIPLDKMAIDIRRCSKEDLDRLNAEARAWRDRKKPGQKQNPMPLEPEAQEMKTSPSGMRTRLLSKRR